MAIPHFVQAKLSDPAPRYECYPLGCPHYSENNASNAALLLSKCITMNLDPDFSLEMVVFDQYDSQYKSKLMQARLNFRTEINAVWEEVGIQLPMLITARDEDRQLLEQVLKELEDLKRHGNYFLGSETTTNLIQLAIIAVEHL
ncbi:hypothetical protein M422DRAFT_254085 [Sphaerobolus stellatus SS14]|uniref:Uncharacterized protein n=1 Tax=Sphaerobolus stellatus (strain SS14) TaxID=990650 RepID=A0A0C9VWD9_SPHS4|nr:hypothetical protein M422DRAFT_254085 [Sphaerobolus stellatus SS14]